MMTIRQAWTIVCDLITRMVARSIHTICLLLVGALMGAWIVHLTESPEVQKQRGLLEESHALCGEIARRWDLCRLQHLEDVEKAKAADPVGPKYGYGKDPPLLPSR
jgi:hypothetical protein